jgi:hypothetical protein
MKRLFRVRVHGSGFVMEMEGGERHVRGFVVSRWVEAPDEHSAGRAAIEMVRTDRRLRGQGTVQLVAKEIEQVSSEADGGNGSGFLFYDADSSMN